MRLERARRDAVDRERHALIEGLPKLDSIMAFLEKTTDVTPDQRGRIDRVVKALVGLSGSQVRGLFSHGCVTLNEAPCTDGGVDVAPGDTVSVRYDIHRRYHEGPRAWEDDAFTIIFEDDHLIVVDKAAGVLTVPATPGEKDTLVHRVTAYLAHRGSRDRAQVVHRLDRDVSGLLVFGKTRDVAEQLQSQFEARKPEREYAAIVKGIVEPEGTFESYLATAKSLQQYSTDKRDDAQLAITHYKRESTVQGASYVRVRLETGRRNQIRVHFADRAHPILGDPRYRPDISDHPQWRAKRLALHAVSLGFDHPVTGKPVRFSSELPNAMRSFIAGKKRGRKA